MVLGFLRRGKKIKTTLSLHNDFLANGLVAVLIGQAKKINTFRQIFHGYGIYTVGHRAGVYMLAHYSIKFKGKIGIARIFYRKDRVGRIGIYFQFPYGLKSRHVQNVLKGFDRSLSRMVWIQPILQPCLGRITGIPRNTKPPINIVIMVVYSTFAGGFPGV